MITVAEAFALAGHPVPEGAKLIAHFLVAASSSASDVRRYWTWRNITELGHFLAGYWQLDKINEKSPDDPMRIITAVSINLANLPAIDAWEQLPDEIKTHPDVMDAMKVAMPWLSFPAPAEKEEMN